MRFMSDNIGDRILPFAEQLGAQLRRVPPGRPWWLALSVPWPEVSFLAILKHAPESPRTYWESTAHPVSLIGWGKALELTDWGEGRFQGIQEQAKHLATQLFPLNPQAPVEACPRWIGSFSFLPRAAAETGWQAFPDAYFILHRFQLARLDNQCWLTINHMVDADHDPDELEGFFSARLAEAEAVLMAAAADSQIAICPPARIKITLKEETWCKMVTGALEHIRKADFRKVVLARTLQADFDGPPAIETIMTNLAAHYPDCFRFLIEPERQGPSSPGQAFLGASPELLAAVEYDQAARATTFQTAALAGTARRGSNQTEDARLAQELLDSSKEREEHAIVVQAIETKLASLASELDISPEPRLRKLGNVQHLETPIHGRLAYGRGVLDVVAALHPTPALGGWPQAPAQDYLATAEPFTRGWYAAPVGWFDPFGNGLFAVGIRSGLFNDRTATLFAGAGIVADSDPLKEWQETGLKFKPLLEAIGGQASDG